jgi:hypothetical protein
MRDRYKILDEVRYAEKARQLAQIRLDRKKIQSERLLQEWKPKSSALEEKRKLLEQAEAAAKELAAKTQNLDEQRARPDTKTRLSVAKKVEDEAATLKSEAAALQQKVSQCVWLGVSDQRQTSR